MPARDASVKELQIESERSRAALAATVERLRDKVGDTTSEIKTRLSPGYIKKEIKDYVREERLSFTQDLQKKARENPLQAVAVGAAIAYPAFGLLRAIPVPLMLIGAGLFFTSQRGRQTAADAKTKLDDVVQRSSEAITDLAATAKSTVEARTTGLRADIQAARDSVGETADMAVDKARAVLQGARDAVSGAAASVAGAAETGISEASSVKDTSVRGIADTKDATANFLKDNALLVASVGAFIAASLPSSDAENKLFGAGSERLKNKARQAAADGIDKATEFATKAAGEAATAAAREGLDAAGVQSALNTVTEGVRAVANRGLQTATGANSSPNQTPSSDQTSPHQTMSERKAL